jgi:hypothetical protein
MLNLRTEHFQILNFRANHPLKISKFESVKYNGQLKYVNKYYYLEKHPKLWSRTIYGTSRTARTNIRFSYVTMLHDTTAVGIEMRHVRSN